MHYIHDFLIKKLYAIRLKSQTLNLRACAQVEGILNTKSTICRDTDTYRDQPERNEGTTKEKMVSTTIVSIAD